MALKLECNDVVPGCEAVVNAETEEELMKKGAEHACDHGLEEIDSATAEKVRSAIQQD